MLGKTNKNDIFELLGPPSTTRVLLIMNVWIYMEMKTNSTKLSKIREKKIAKKQCLTSRILITEVLLVKKIFFDIR